MKKVSLITIIFLSTLAGCKSDADIFKGDYSYKTSGTVYVEYNKSRVTYNLDNQVGQLRIVELTGSDSVLLIKNPLKGEVETMRAKVAGDSIYIAPYKKQLSFFLTDSINGNYDITVSGRGVMYDKNTIVLNENYYGIGIYDTTRIQIYSENITTLAQRNE